MLSPPPPMQIHKMHSFLDYIMGGCQIQFTVSCFLVCSYSRGKTGGWCWAWSTRRQKSIKTLVSFVQVSLLKYGRVTCFLNKFILLFFPVNMVFNTMSGNSCHSTLGGVGSHPNTSYSFSDYMRHEAIGVVPGAITWWEWLEGSEPS